MDLQETLFIIVIIAFTVLVAVRTRRQHEENNSKKDVPSEDPLPRLSAKPSLKPFQHRTSKPQTKKEIVSGKAYIVDGDTIKIGQKQIRLFGIDAPEMNHPFGKKAKWALVSLCKGQTVRAEVTDTDAHGRVVAKCSLPCGKDLSAEMVKLGLAIDWPKFSNGQYGPLEVPNVRKKLWLADARQKGRIHVWQKFEVQQKAKATNETS